MILSLQTVGWSLLAPQPIDLHGPVCCFLGPNGSGKSSALDSLKALLGARRFGQGRTCASYRFAGRAGSGAVQRAYVIGLVDNRLPLAPSRPRLKGFSEQFTIILEVASSQRRFLVLDGNQLLDAAGDLDGQLLALREQHPRSQWLRPSDYERRILDPLGVGPAVRRLLELPQGEIQRALDKDPKALVGLLVELTGGRDSAEAFIRAQEALKDARQAHAESRRRLDRRRAELAELRLAAEQSRRRGELRDQLSTIRAQIEATLAANPEPELKPQAQASAKAMSERVLPAQTPRSQAATPTAGVQVFNRAALSRAGITLVLHDGLWCVPEEDAEHVRGLLAPGQSLPVAAEALEFLRRRGALVSGPPAADRKPELVRSEPNEPDPAPETEAEVEAEIEPALTVKERRRLVDALKQLVQADIPAADSGEDLPSAGELLGAMQALIAHGMPDRPDEEIDRKVRALGAAVEADRSDLDERERLLADAGERLREARDAYQKATWRALNDTAQRFGQICAAAGLAGRMDIVETPDGPQCRIWAAETVDEELRPLHGAQASLSGGWRATVVVLAVLACLDTDGSLGILPLDEVGASLDEPRLAALGHAFAALGEQRGLVTVMTLPTKAMSETVAEFARQQVGFVRPLADEAVAPPPHIVTAPVRLKKAA
jgi:energy-coupling factor transporter ATP-binding protein EcfA2